MVHPFQRSVSGSKAMVHPLQRSVSGSKGGSVDTERLQGLYWNPYQSFYT